MRKLQIQTDEIEAYLANIPLPKITNEQTLSCEGIISEYEVFKSLSVKTFKSLKSMENNKSPGNDGLSIEFYECFWNEIEKQFLASVHKTFLNQELNSSQKQSFIKNWRSISLFNTDMKIISKVLSTRIKNVLPFLISSNQTAYFKNRFVGKSGRVISDILEITNTLALEGSLVTAEIEKVFDSVNHCFLLQILRKFFEKISPYLFQSDL